MDVTFMSMKATFEILKEMGGKAYTNEISEVARKKYPNKSLHTYVSRSLKRLEKNEYVTYTKYGKRKKTYWRLLKNTYLE